MARSTRRVLIAGSAAALAFLVGAHLTNLSTLPGPMDGPLRAVSASDAEATEASMRDGGIRGRGPVIYDAALTIETVRPLYAERDGLCLRQPLVPEPLCSDGPAVALTGMVGRERRPRAASLRVADEDQLGSFTRRMQWQSDGSKRTTFADRSIR